MSDNDDGRVTELEIKLSYQEKRIADLDEGLVAHSRRIEELEDTVKALKVALQRVRNENGAGDVLGAYPEDDPVPRSG